jgi:hypothetical protein
LPKKAEARSPSTRQGYVDFYGYHTMAGGWLFCGWVSSEVYEMSGAPAVVAQFERGEICGEAVRRGLRRRITIVDGMRRREP